MKRFPLVKSGTNCGPKGILGKISYSWAGEEKIETEPRESYRNRKEISTQKIKGWAYQRSQPERASNGQSQNDLNSNLK